MAGTDDRELEEIRRKKMQEYLSKMAGNKNKPEVEEPLIKHISDRELQQAIERGENFLLDLWAEWCGPCKMLEPIFEKLAKEFRGKVKFYKLNVDEYPQVSMKYGVMGIPTVLFFRRGKAVDRVVGVMPESVFLGKINQHYF